MAIMKKVVVIVVGVVLIIGLGVGAYWLVTQREAAPIAQPTPASSPSPASTIVPSPIPTPTPVSKDGTIEGSLSFPGEGIPEGMEICAENQTTKEVYCTSKHIQDLKYTYRVGYKLDVPAGTYLVYASDPYKDYLAYYSEFVTCGLSVDCPSHEPILVEVKASKTTNEVDPQDWYK